MARAFARGLPPLNAARAKIGLAPIGHPFDQLARADRVLVLTGRAFDFPAAWLPPNVRYVGPQLDDPAWVGPWRSPWANGDNRPLVVVAFSTTFQDQAKIVQRVIDALGQLLVRGLATTGPALAPEQFRAPPNVAVQPSARIARSSRKRLQS